MRVSSLVAFLTICLFGCSHYNRLDPSDFDRAGMSRVKFSRDNYDCQSEGVIRQYMVKGGDPVGVYNRAYARCMKKRGYATTDLDLTGIGG